MTQGRVCNFEITTTGETQGNTFAVEGIRAYYTLEHSDDVLKIDMGFYRKITSQRQNIKKIDHLTRD